MSPEVPLRGPALQPGDRVRLVSPSSPPTQAWLDESIDVVSGWGLRAEVGTHAVDTRGFMAGDDDARLADLNDALRDPGVRAVITTRGGAGAYRIADRIDVEAVKADPKPVVGFSDITNVHLALWRGARLATIHGCLAGPTARADVLGLLTDPRPTTIDRNPAALSAAVEVAGRATGPLVGGNLRELAGWVGTGAVDLAGAILLIEDRRHVGIGQVDRNLTQLRRSGWLGQVAGVVVGSFEAFAGYVDSGWTVVDVLQDRLCDLGVPVLGGLDLGHDVTTPDGSPDQHAVTLGATATIDVGAGTLTVGPCVR